MSSKHKKKGTKKKNIYHSKKGRRKKNISQRYLSISSENPQITLQKSPTYQISLLKRIHISEKRKFTEISSEQKKQYLLESITKDIKLYESGIKYDNLLTQIERQLSQLDKLNSDTRKIKSALEKKGFFKELAKYKAECQSQGLTKDQETNHYQKKSNNQHYERVSISSRPRKNLAEKVKIRLY